MRIGISLTTSLRVEDAREGVSILVERTAAAAAAGLDSLFVGDHHNTGPGKYYQNLPTLGRLLAEWDERPAGALFLLPLFHPVMLAEQIGTLASIHKGRFIMQCAIGPDDAQFRGLGVDPKHRPSRFEQSLDIMRRLWAGETVGSDGRWSFRDATIAPLPPDGVEVWIGSVASPAIDRSARLGDGWLASPGLTPDQAAAASADYFERCQIHGREPTAVAIRRDIYVGESDEEAMETTAAVRARGYRGMDPAAPVVGSPETVASAFRELAQAGYTDVIVRNMMPGREHALGSIRRLAEVRSQVGGA